MMIDSPFANYWNSKSLEGWTAALGAVVLATWAAGGLNNDLYILYEYII